MRSEPAAKASPVWARGNVTVDVCPKSYISAASQTLVEEFMVRKRLGERGLHDISAKQVEAFLLLEEQLAAEMKHGQQPTANTL
jgi:hypothetical protein